jgi:4-amino-4-deoxy-L-arabinose transferase-like glycosyltransferase
LDTPATSFGKRWPIYGLLLLNAALPSLIVVLTLWPLAQRTQWRNYWFDDRYLYDQAASMQERLGLHGDDPAELDAVRDRMPLYPLLLRGLRQLEELTTIPVPAWSILTNVAAQGLSTLLLFHLVMGLSGRRSMALGTALLWPWLPGVMPYTLAQLPEAVSTFLCIAASVLLLTPRPTNGRKGWICAALAGLALGMATLFKPVFCTYCVPCLVLIWLRARAAKTPVFRQLLGFLAVFLLTLAPWLVRNHLVWGKATLTPNGMAHVANARDAMAAELGLPPVDPRVPRTPEGWRAVGIDPADLHTRSIYRSRLAWRDLYEHAGDWFRVAAKSVLKLHASTGIGALVTMSSGNLAIDLKDQQPEPRQDPAWSPGWQVLQYASLAMLAVVYLLALVGLVVLWNSQRILFWWTALTLAYFVAISVPFGNTRYRYPAMPAYAVLAAAGAVHLFNRRTLREPT